eukprot:3848372-Amphidinium_carterae.1
MLLMKTAWTAANAMATTKPRASTEQGFDANSRAAAHDGQDIHVGQPPVTRHYSCSLCSFAMFATVCGITTV